MLNAPDPRSSRTTPFRVARGRTGRRSPLLTGSAWSRDGRAGPEPRTRVVVGVGLLLRRAQVLRHVLEVHADAGPRRGAPAHGVDQHVGRLQVRGGLRVARLPALEAGQR